MGCVLSTKKIQLELYLCYIITERIYYTTITVTCINVKTQEGGKGDTPPAIGSGESKVKDKYIN